VNTAQLCKQCHGTGVVLTDRGWCRPSEQTACAHCIGHGLQLPPLPPAWTKLAGRQDPPQQRKGD
jgi:hypothetical protein